MSRLFIASALIALSGCGSSAPTIASGPLAPTVVDGDASDWAGALVALADDRVALGVRNDGERLAVAVVTSDPDAIRHTILTGMTVWVDAGGGDARAYGVQFPLGLFGDGEVPDLRALREAGAGDADRGARLERMLGELAVVAGGQRRVYARDGAPVEADASLEAGQLVLEVSVPLDALGVRPGDAVGVGVETPELDRDALRAQLRAQMRGRGGMGGRAGRGGRRGGMGGRAGRGGERPDPPEPVEVWVRVPLAD
jgi:hypothetical protein